MKRISAIFMAAMIIMLCSCGNNAAEQDDKFTDEHMQAETRLEETDTTEESDTGGKTEMNVTEENDVENQSAVLLPEEFVLIPGGTFQMGSSKEEAWRSEDEVQHTVTILMR